MDSLLLFLCGLIRCLDSHLDSQNLFYVYVTVITEINRFLIGLQNILS